VDDQTLVREGFRKLLELEPDFVVAGTAADGQAALGALYRLAGEGRLPDVILMDIRMPHMNGIEATREVKKNWPGVHVVILTTFDDMELIREGLSAGALGYSLKDITAEQLALTVRLAATGQVLLQPEIAGKLFASFASPERLEAPVSEPLPPTPAPAARGQGETLTEREREILGLVAKGASNREIAEALFLTEGTVKNHMTSIFSKIGARDRIQAALKAQQMKLG
jgi:DNA-binding NarL/FixJ family response regulator